MQHQQAQPGEYVPVDAFDDLVGHLAVRGMPPPDQDVQVVEHLLGETVLGLVQGGGPHPGPLAQVLGDAGGDGGVHALGIDGGHVRFDLLVPVLPPHEDPDARRTVATDMAFPSVVQVPRLLIYLTAPPVAPAAMYRCAITSRMIAGMEASMAVAITALQLEMCAPR